MKALPLTPELLDIAPRVLWFEDPKQALATPARFMAYLMTYGLADDIATVRKYLTAEDFTTVLDVIPPGIMDARSWAYWNAMAGRYPTPPMPRRTFPV